jgi:FtsZ-interacting cell division protein YlmF
MSTLHKVKAYFGMAPMDDYEDEYYEDKYYETDEYYLNDATTVWDTTITTEGREVV